MQRHWEFICQAKNWFYRANQRRPSPTGSKIPNGTATNCQQFGITRPTYKHSAKDPFKNLIYHTMEFTNEFVNISHNVFLRVLNLLDAVLGCKYNVCQQNNFNPGS